MSDDVDRIETIDEGWDQFSSFAIALKTKLKSIDNFDENDFINKFQTLKDNRTRIEYCLNDDKVVKGVQQLFEDINKSKDNNPFDKNCSKSEEFRQKADHSFKSGLFSESLRFYSEAICLAPVSTSGSTDQLFPLAMAFAGRSQVLLRVEDFESCLSDIEEAFRYDCPEEQKAYLLLRKAKCLAGLAKIDSALGAINELKHLIKSVEQRVIDEVETEIERLLIEIKLQREEKNDNPDDCESDNEDNDQKDKILDPNPLLPNASSSIKVDYNKNKGRFVTAVNEVTFGDTLIVEQPFATYLYSTKLEDYCSYCFNLLDNHWVPCNGCTQIRFCGHLCREKAWNEYHSLECKTMYFLSNEIGISYLVLRILLRTGIEDVIRISKEMSQTNQSKVDNSYSSDYRSIYQLLDHQNEHNSDSIISYTLAALFILLVLEKNSLIPRDDENYVLLAEVILKHIQQLSTNLISILEQNFGEDFNKFGFDGSEEIIGTGIYPTICLLNHSCDPNVLTFFNGKQLTVKASKNIKVGEEVNYCYGPNFQRMSRKDRQKKLKNQYYFECQCFVCANNKENLTRALLCHQCNGPVIHNEDFTSECLNCKNTELNVRKAIENVENGLKYSTEGLDLLSRQRMSDALVSLHRADELLTLNLYIQNRLLCKSKDDLCRCYASMGHFDRAVAYCQQSVRITSRIFGEQSTELLIELMKLVSLKWELVDETEDSATKKTLANELLDVIKRADQIVSKFKTTQGFENAFQSELQFLNEKRLSVLSLV